MSTFNRVMAFISAALATAFVGIWWLQGVSEPVRLSVGVLVFWLLASPVFEWQWRKGAWWALPLIALVGTPLVSMIPQPPGHWKLIFPAAIAIGIIVQWYLQRRQHA